MTNLTKKDIRKGAFAVGFGWTLGVSMGKIVSSCIDATVKATIDRIYAHLASKGSETAKKFCGKYGLEYEVEDKPEK